MVRILQYEQAVNFITKGQLGMLIKKYNNSAVSTSSIPAFLGASECNNNGIKIMCNANKCLQNKLVNIGTTFSLNQFDNIMS